MTDARRRFLYQLGLLFGASATSISAETIPGLDPKSGLDGIRKLFSRKDPVMWVFTGDSITHGALHTYGWRSYPEHFAERVRWELKRVRDVVINTGISGDRTDGILKDLQWRVLQFRPHVVSLMFGMNDCGAGPAGRDKFRTNLRELVRKIQDSGAIPLVNTQNTIYLKNATSRGDLPAYAQITREVAHETQAGLIDHYEYWSRTKPDQETLLPWIEDKSIHPGVYGHRAFAKLIFRELGIYDDKSLTCQLEVP